MSKPSFFERLFHSQERKPEPKQEPQPTGVSRTFPDGVVLWADDQETLDFFYEKMKGEHELRS